MFTTKNSKNKLKKGLKIINVVGLIAYLMLVIAFFFGGGEIDVNEKLSNLTVGDMGMIVSIFVLIFVADYCGKLSQTYISIYENKIECKAIPGQTLFLKICNIETTKNDITIMDNDEFCIGNVITMKIHEKTYKVVMTKDDYYKIKALIGKER